MLIRVVGCVRRMTAGCRDPQAARSERGVVENLNSGRFNDGLDRLFIDFGLSSLPNALSSYTSSSKKIRRISRSQLVSPKAGRSVLKSCSPAASASRCAWCA